MELLERFETFYRVLNRDSLTSLPEIYSGEVRFIDPVTEHRGIGALTDYFEKLLGGCDECQFNIHNKNMSESAGYVEWTMLIKHPKLKRGRAIEVEGVSVLSIADDRITEQRDYYDLGAMMYEHIPLLGSVVAWLRRRLAA